jgi:hypothetical protein
MDDFLELCHELIGEGEPRGDSIDELVDEGMNRDDAEELYDDEYNELTDDIDAYLKKEGLLEAVFNLTIRSSLVS